MNSENKNIYSVTRLNRAAKSLLENGLGFIWLSAEISNLTIAISGHWYFTLKDHGAQVKCAMFKGSNRHTHFTPKHGQQVLVRGKLSLYEARGDYQLIIESMQAEGDGALKKQFEALKCQLASEGLFSTKQKKILPHIIQRIGIITSTTGAALFDILSVLKRRDPRLQVIIYPSLVQGQSSAASIVTQIQLANARNECDLLIVGRGGGSLEDLACFNDIQVAYAIFKSNLPIISAVGHEIDVTISDFVADIRAATPSAAAELVSQNKTFVISQLSTLVSHLQRAISTYIQHDVHQHSLLQEKLKQQDPQHKLQQKKLMTDELSLRLSYAIQQTISKASQKNATFNASLRQCSPQRIVALSQQKQIQLHSHLQTSLLNYFKKKQMHLHSKMAQLNAVSPLATLARGYAIVKNAQGKVVTDVTTLENESYINIHFSKGEVQAKIIK
ncbi:exodeoxyribonuclease VII large subunit [Psychromonas sp. CD1]|uniref:exodeoxyribonuclease VII large subunit n=1 Tax=Psychromonas sp. CD1 TaxID=1979839 RepID=UPI000B9B966E|nr:exodeoxyribonuclease VII large subunit [Psychromonas sp. CD1]